MKILVVEDEAGIATFLRKGLQEEGFIVDVATNGKEGLEKALAQAYGVILLDWMLPGLSGLDVCTRLRKAGDQTPIIFITARDTVQETIIGLRAGANDYIRKPFDFEELLERVKVHFREIEEEITTLELGDIRIDLLTHQVFRGNEDVALTQKEFQLLEFLMRHKGRICTRTQIIEEVWNIHFDYDTGVIDVFMNSLRKKLQLRKEDDLIRTIRGVGYIANEIAQE